MHNRFIVLSQLLCLIGLTPAVAETPVQNVLLIVSDDLKASALGCFGNVVCDTPNLDKLARRGMVFENAYCQGTWCAPSRQSFMYSRYQGKQGTNLGEHFRNHQRYTARVGKIYHMRVPGDIIDGTDGQDVASSWTERFNSPGKEAHTPGNYACLNQNIFTTDLEARESTGMPHRAFVSVAHPGDGSDQPDAKTAAKTIELLRKHQDEPFFIAAGLIRPHYPMVAPQGFFDRYPWAKMALPASVENDQQDIPKLGIPKSTAATNGIGQYPNNQKRMWAAYYASVTFMDEQVGRILDELKRLGLEEKTAVVFISDHGYHLGEHEFWQKHNLHEEVTRVPMIIAAPGQKSGRTNSITELVDIYPTVVELAGLPIPESVQGVSLVPVLADPTATVKQGALSFQKGTALREKAFAYMRYNDGSEELYDMREDPLQFQNLSAHPQYQETQQALRHRLENRLTQAGIE